MTTPEVRAISAAKTDVEADADADADAVAVADTDAAAELSNKTDCTAALDQYETLQKEGKK